MGQPVLSPSPGPPEAGVLRGLGHTTTSSIREPAQAHSSAPMYRRADWGTHPPKPCLRSGHPGQAGALARPRQAPRARPSSRRHAIKVSPYPVEDGGANGPPADPPGGGVPTDEFDEEEAKVVEDVLHMGGTSSDQLPVDMQEALEKGHFSRQDARDWLRICRVPLYSYLAQMSPLRDRLMGNPRFLLTVAVELLVGCGAKLIAEAQARKERFWAEANFVLSDLALEICCDISTVFLLSPRSSFGEAPASKAGRTLATLPAHAFQMGNFSLAQRAGTLALRGVQFGVIGFVASAIGHTVTVKLVEHQQAKQRAEWEARVAALPPLPPRWQFWRSRHQEGVPPLEEAPHLAPVWDNSIGWGSFSAASVQLRYQAVNAIEERLFASVIRGSGLRSATSFGVRFLNSIVGGVLWIDYARYLGLQ